MIRAIRHWGGLFALVALAGAGAAFAGAGAAFAGAGAATAQPAEAPKSAAASESCAAKTGVLGVSRVIEIDATGGPRFGQLQYKDLDPLADKEVVLTFDDGPARRFTMPILDALDAECTKATFFAVGRMALADPETLKETDRRGHTIATHSWSHKRLYQIGTAKAKDEIELGISAVSRALGRPVAPFFRFPYLGDNAALRSHLEGRNQSAFSIDVDSRDFNTRNPAVVRSRVMAQLRSKGKGIILFHDIQPSTAGALPTLLDELKKEGFKVVHLVAKQPSTTLPDYDAIAAKEEKRRKVTLGSQPLADRSVVWPAGQGFSKPASAQGGEELPWQTKPGEALGPPGPKPRLRPSLGDDGWATRPLGE